MQTTTITFTRDQLNRRAAIRPEGYAADILAYAKSVGVDRWEISRDNWDLVAHKHRMGAGTAAQKLIHAVVDASPLPDGVKKKIKLCKGCGKRVRQWNKVIPDIRRPLAK